MVQESARKAVLREIKRITGTPIWKLEKRYSGRSLEYLEEDARRIRQGRIDLLEKIKGDFTGQEHEVVVTALAEDLSIEGMAQIEDYLDDLADGLGSDRQLEHYRAFAEGSAD